MGDEPESTLSTGELLPVCMSSWPGVDAMGPVSDIIHLSPVYGKWWRLSSPLVNVANATQNGGLYCDENGNIQKPFPAKPYCQATTAVIGVQNNAGTVVSFCQTVLPGNEAMLIPTSVESWSQLAVPDTSYWCETAAHYYINPPGITTDVACVWGTNANPWGNWSPYVAGANTDASGNTFIKLGWNPIYLEPATPFRNTMPSWGVEIVCNGAGCNGLPCAIDPTKNGVNEMVGSSTDGAGGGAFCVVTVPQGVSANFVVTNSGESSSSSSSSSGTSSSSISSSSRPFNVPTFTEAQGRAGEFYATESSSWSASSLGTTASATTSTWKWSSASTTAHSYSNFTSVYAPTHSPYYSLFNYTHASTSAVSGTAETTTSVLASALASATEPTIAPSQPPFSSASDLKLPALSFVASAIAASLAVYL